MAHVSSRQRSPVDSSEVPTVWLQSLVRFSVEGKRFKISPHRIYEESNYFTEKYLAGHARGSVVVLEEVTALQWSTFMVLLSPRLSTFTASLEFTKSQWIDVLAVATTFRFDRFRKMAMYRLGELLFDPLEAVVLGRQAYFSDWVLKAYDILVRREAPITEEESEVIGHLTTVRLFNIRHSLHWELGHCRDDPPAHAELGVEAQGAERDEERVEGGDEPVPLSEVDDVVRHCLLQKFEEEFALIEEEETKRHYSEYGEESDDDEEGEEEEEGDADADGDMETTTKSALLDEEDEEALEEYLNQEEEDDTSLSSISAGSRSPWDPDRLIFVRADKEYGGDDDDDDDQRTRVGSQHSESGDTGSEEDEDDSPVNSISSGERTVVDEDETGVPCINLIGYDAPPLESGNNALGIYFAPLTNFRRIGDLGSGAVVGNLDENPTSSGARNVEVFRRPASSPGAESGSIQHEEQQPQFPTSSKVGGWPKHAEGAIRMDNSLSPQGPEDHLKRYGSEQEDANEGSHDDTLCRVA